MTRNRILSVLLVGLCAVSLSAHLSAQIDFQQRIASAQGRTPAGANTLSNSHSGIGTVPAHFAQLKLAPGFLLSLNVLDDPDFTGTFRVDEKGNIDLPVLGAIHVGGKTAPEAREAVAKDLTERGILKDPIVELNIVEYMAPQVTVLGAVSTPGVFPLLAPEGLGDVLVLAGDTTLLAGDTIEITAPNGGREPERVHYSRQTDTKQLNSVIVQPGDTVKVMQAGVIYVLGAVGRPGGYVMQADGHLSVMQALSIAGGTSMTASVQTVYVMRKNGDHADAWLELPYRKMTQGKVSDVQLHTNDIVYVPNSRFKSTLMNSQGIIASLSSASIYAGVLH